jgi:DNA-binding CsgD family transcriptional regulator
MEASPLLERDLELATIQELLGAVGAGAGRVLVIEGPAGIGKSSLLGAARAAGSGMRIASARCSELEREFPLGVARQLLEPVLAGAAVEERRTLLLGAAALGAQVLGESASSTEEVADTAAALHGLYWLTANAASLRPLLLLVDDAQWADVISLRWIAYLAARLDGIPLALVVAVRLGEVVPAQHVLDELASGPGVRVLRPETLSGGGVARLIEQRFGQQPDPAFAEACELATGGNPFLLGELVAELRRDGVEPTAANVARAAAVSPRSVARAIQARLRRLPPTCRSLARAVAILGDGTSLDDAAELAGLEAATASSAADSLASAGLLEGTRPLSFVHPLVRSSVETELSAGERAAGHARAAARLLARGAASERVAIHLLACEARSDPEVVRVLREAAAGARRRGATDATVAYLRRALDEPPGPELEADVAFELGAAELRAADVAPAIEHLRQAVRGQRDRTAAALAAAELGTALAFTNRPEEGVTALNDAIAALSDDERELGLLLQVTRSMVAPVSLAAWQLMEAAGERFEASPADAASTGERLHVAELALRAAGTSTAERARTLALAALGNGALLDEPGPIPLLVFKAPIALCWADALEEATAVLSELIERSQRRGAVMMFAQASHIRAAVWWRRGALAEAEADAENALRYPSPQLRLGVLALVETRLAQGDVDGAEKIWRDAGLEADHGSGRAEPVPLQTRARLAAAQGHTERALADLFRCGRIEDAWGIRTPALCNWRNDAARLSLTLGRHDEARRLALEEVERSRAFGAARPTAAALQTLALTEQGSTALGLLQEAVELVECSPARLEHALALYELGAALRRSGQRAAARDRLEAALELAVACGARLVATRAHDELVTAGARPRRDPIESRSRLTASELRVARMATTGLTNREIAQSLFLTEKTIENHLRSAYRKLSIRSRSQLTRALPADPEPVTA